MEEFLTQPYSKRQFIIIERDEVINAKQIADEKLNEEKTKNGKEGGYSFLRSALEISLASLIGTIPSVVLVDITIKIIEKQKELSKKINVNYKSFTESTSFKFPIGHPREGELYVAHPVMSGVYYPINEFHKKVFEHKFSELNLLLMDLGVKKVEVEYVSGWDLETMNELSIPKTKAKLKINILNSRKIIYKANYKDNNSLKLPENLSWYYFEPAWQSVGEGRLKHGLQDFNLTLDYNDDFGINAELVATISKIGVGSKNSFTKQENTVWKIAGAF